MGRISSDNVHGLVLAISSSVFIGSSFIIKKKGLKKAGVSGIRAGMAGKFVPLLVYWINNTLLPSLISFANSAACKRSDRQVLAGHCGMAGGYTDDKVSKRTKSLVDQTQPSIKRFGLTCARRVTHRLTEVDLFLVGLVEAMQKSAHETCANILLFRFGRALLLEGTLVVGWDGNEKEIDRLKAWEAYEKVRKSKVKGTTSGGHLFYGYLEILNISSVYEVKTRLGWERNAMGSGTLCALLGPIEVCLSGEPALYNLHIMIGGEIANFAAYAFAPAILVTPLGALSIIFSAVLAHFILEEKLHIFGVVGCCLCLVGSTTIVLHAPQERKIESVREVWHLATEPVSVDRNNRFPVMSVKAVGIALKLSFSGSNQFTYFETWFFTILVLGCCILQINYLNKALDTFNTAVVSPFYYVMFTTLTIFASMIMFKDWDSQDATDIATELCGFVTILSGTFLLHKTKDMGSNPVSTLGSPVFHPSPDLSAHHSTRQVEL
ncbi:hypothetical protein RHSIM_Rhsim09G0059000 [Rhododendron simsii]|uniref:Probable magnesium transporter n=1 Tax=Rhododendron simsii TaxID=118357 RepID=A0A834GE65_RHOSS|nr:hypothetical protein RHSIM_Rhsim09G0059000 [Rhododendron simsii]